MAVLLESVYNAVAMNLSRTVRLLLALASGVALALAYPLFNIPLLGWIAPAILIVAVLGERPRFAFLLGSLQGAVYYGLSLPWFYTVMRQYGPLPVIQAGAVFALVIVVMSFFHAAFAAAIAWLGKFAPERACLAAPFLWVALEFAAMHMPAIGFPWNLLGYVAAGNLALDPADGDHGNFWSVASGRGIQRSCGLGHTAIIAAEENRIEIVDGSHSRADPDRTRGTSICAASFSGSCRPFGADEFSRVQRLSSELDAIPRGGYGSAGTDQHRGGAKSSRHCRVAGGSSAVFFAGRNFSCPRPAHRSRRRRRLFGRRDRLEAAGAAAGSARTTAQFSSARMARWTSSTTRFISCPSANTCPGENGSSLPKT